MSDNLFKLIIAIIPVIGAVITGFLIPYLRSKIGNEKLTQYMSWAKSCVQFAEMIYSEDKWREKKAYCVEFLSNEIKGALTPEQIDVLIESAVIELKLAEKSIGANK